MHGFLVFYSNETLEKIFLDSFIRDKFSNFIKILILISSLFVLFASQNFMKDMKISKFGINLSFIINSRYVFHGKF